MKLTVIGCWHAYPKQGEATSGYLLEHEEFRLLIDCGSGVVSQMQSYVSIEDLDAVILSHYHHDHVTDIGVLQYACLLKNLSGIKKEPLTIYGHLLDKDKFNSLSYPPYVLSVPYDEANKLNVGPFTVSFFKTRHPVPCFAMKFQAGNKTFVYTADTSYMEELAEFSAGCDILLAECSTYEDSDLSAYGHMNSKEAAMLAKRSNTKRLVLTHLPHIGEQSKLAMEASQYFNGNIDLAKQGKSFEM